MEKNDRSIRSFPKGIVHQDAHPAQFIRVSDQALAVVDTLNLSYDVAYTDLAGEYLFKIVRAYHRKEISKKTALIYLKATLLPDWVDGKQQHLFSCPIIAFANQGLSLADCYRIDEKNADRIHLAVNLDSFVSEFLMRMDYDQTYQNQLLPSLNRTNDLKKNL